MSRIIIYCMLYGGCGLSWSKGAARWWQNAFLQNESEAHGGAFQTNAILHPPGDAVKQTMQHI